MPDLDTRRRGALQDFDALIDTLDTMPVDAWDAEVPCEGWKVRDLAAHLTGTIAFLERGLSEMLAERHGATHSSAVEGLEATASPRELVTALRAARDGLGAQLDAITDADVVRDPAEEVGFLSPSIDMYLDLTTFEAAIHRNDLDVALGDVDAPIGDHGLAAIDAILGSNMVDFAGMTDAAPYTPLSIGFTAPSINHTLTWTGTSWSGEPAEGVPSARIAGTDSAVTRFICGRIPIDDPLLTVDGQIEIARQFKTFVPGP